MIIYFVEAERAEEDFFATHLDEHDLRLAAHLDEVGDDVEILSTFINSPLDPDFLAAHPRLRLIATRSQAVDHIDLAACRARGVCVTHVPHYGDTTVSEHTFALILATSRRLRELLAKPKNSRFSYEATRAFDLAGKTLGIVGMGRIGRRVAALAEAFQMKVIASDVKEAAGVAETLHFEFVPHEELFARSHIISLHTPLTPETYHIVNRENLALCRPGVIIINTARGALVDTGALVEALDSGQVGGAGLDVLQDERVLRESAAHIIAGDIVKHLRSDAVAHEARDADRLREVQELMLSDAILTRANVFFTPHVAFNSIEAVARLREVTVENINAFLAGSPVNVVT
ncbi:MAG: NAD(P)-dependent oxidoreductase [Chthoniobacteraceae bacterium]